VLPRGCVYPVSSIKPHSTKVYAKDIHNYYFIIWIQMHESTGHCQMFHAYNSKVWPFSESGRIESTLFIYFLKEEKKIEIN